MKRAHSKVELMFLITTFIYILFNLIIYNILFINFYFIFDIIKNTILVWSINIVLTVLILIGLFYFKKSKRFDEKTKNRLIKYNLIALLFFIFYSFVEMGFGNYFAAFGPGINEVSTDDFWYHMVFYPEVGGNVFFVITLILIVVVAILFILEIIYVIKKIQPIENTEEVIKEKKETKKTVLKLF